MNAGAGAGGAPLWSPDGERLSNANMTRFASLAAQRYKLKLENHRDLHRWSVEHPERFWELLAEFTDVRFTAPWSTVMRAGPTLRDTEWFEGARLNFADNLLRHADGPLAEREAIVFHPEQGERVAVTFAQLKQRALRVAAAFREWGVGPGDRVAGYLPNQIETVVAMLAATALGAIWTACSPDFGLDVARDRFGQIEPKVLLATPGYRYNGKLIDTRDKAQRLAQQLPSVTHTVSVPYPELDLQLDGAIAWSALEEHAPADPPQFLPTAFNHPAYILYSSGTTGAPKCIVHGVGGTLLQHHKEHVLHTDLNAGDRLFYFTTCAWMMWHWLVSALAIGTTIVLYDGSPFHPGPERLWEIAEREKLTVFGTSARYIAEMENQGYSPRDRHDLAHLKAVLSTGSPLAERGYRYVYRHIKQDVCLASISGGTDIISCFVLGNPVLPVHAGRIQGSGLGMDVAFVDERGERVVGRRGELACRNPFPSMPVGFWNDPDGSRYRSSYFARSERVWMHGDHGMELPGGEFVIHGRSDAVLNPGGVRIGTAEIYSQLEAHPEIVDAVVVEADRGGDGRIALFVVLKQGVKLNDELRGAIKRNLRSKASPRHVPAHIEQVEAVPRTLNGKLAELVVRDIVNGEPLRGVETLANPECLEGFKGRI